MVDYFHRLVLRSLQPQAVMQPRLAGRFEPGLPGGPFWIDGEDSVVRDSLAEDINEQPEAPGRRADLAPANPVNTPRSQSDIQDVSQGDQLLRPPSPRLSPPTPGSERADLQGLPMPQPAPPARREMEPARAGQVLDDQRARLAPQPALQPAALTRAVEQQARLDAEQSPPDRSAPAQPEIKPAPPRLELKPILAPASLQERSDPGRNAAAPPPLEPAPIVHITIGRIEVRAAPAPKTTSPARKSRIASPVMNLEEYLKKRNGGGG